MIQAQVSDLIAGRPVIFYGAGQYAEAYYSDLKEVGIEPACFVDKDPKKQYKTICGRKILPLSEALEKYPDCLLYLTVSEVMWNAVEKELTANNAISTERILNHKIEESYKSCFALQHELTTYNARLTPCCVPLSRKPWVSVNAQDYDAAVDQYLKLRDDVVKMLNSEQNAPYCDTCPFLVEQHWFGNKKIRVLNVSDQGVCQFRCVYCSNPNKNNKMSDQPLTNYLELLSALERKGLIDDNLLVRIGPDEITVHPEADRVLSAFKRYAAEVFTNAAVYNETVAEILENSRSSLLVSMDAGTKATFAKIKGVDCWETVCENLKRYASHGAVKLKYILLPGINDNYDDADGFIKLCLDIGAANVMLSRNKNDKRELPEQSLEIGHYIRALAERNGLGVGFVDEFLGSQAVETMNQ